MSPKKLINDPDFLIEELIEGIVTTHPKLLRVEGKAKRAIVAKKGARPGKVGVVIGGGSGHEPAFACYVGQGLADAAPIGNIFASPSPAHIIDAALSAERGEGVLFLYGNYAGDVMNFDMATEQLGQQGIDARSFLVTDDIASAPKERSSERRGIAGDFFVFKVAGAASDLGLNIDAVIAAATRANDNTRTMGVALSACSMPQTGKANFEIPEGEMEIGMGIHGEPGVARVPIETADDVTDRLLQPIVDELKLNAGDSVAVLVNGLGSTTLLEQYLVHRRVSQTLSTKNIHIHNSWVGEYCTSLEMAGVSVTLMKLDDDLETWLDHPCHTPALTVGGERVRDETKPQEQSQSQQTTPEFNGQTGGLVQDKSNLNITGHLTPTLFVAALQNIGAAIIHSKDELCELDGVIGDGDHGITMEIGWKAILTSLDEASDETTISEICIKCAGAFLDSVGASAGPLYASAFNAAARAVLDRQNLDATATAALISAMAEGIQTRGKASIGEKTMVDAWAPASKAAILSAQQGGSIKEVAIASAQAARQGADQTKDLVSKRGRSKVLGERSIGHIDPGAQSAAILLGSFASFLSSRL